MATNYQYRVTIAVPEVMMEKANHLALIMGERSEDINTFTTAQYQNSSGDKYAVCSTVVTGNFIDGASSGELPASPAHASSANRTWASEVYSSLGQPNGLIMVVDNNPQDALMSIGLIVIDDYAEGQIS